MRRKDKEFFDKAEISAIIKQANVCRLGMVDGNKPYVIPLCFGYSDNVIYFHCALEGKKNDLIRKNPNVCVEFDLFAETIESEKACGWSMKYQSVIVFGQAFFIEDLDEKKGAMNIIMKQYSDKSFQFPENQFKAIAVIKVDIESITAKQSGMH